MHGRTPFCLRLLYDNGDDLQQLFFGAGLILNAERQRRREAEGFSRVERVERVEFPSPHQTSPGRALAKPVRESPWLTSLPHGSVNHRPTRTRCAYACAIGTGTDTGHLHISILAHLPRSGHTPPEGNWKTTKTTKASQQAGSARELARTARLGRASILFADFSC